MTTFNPKDLFKNYEEHHAEFSQTPFWFWNDHLDQQEITRQLEDFKDHGIYGVVIHPRAGLPKQIEWMSETYLDYVNYAVEEAERLGIWVILYDEAMYPSGSSCGQVVAENPDFACRGLFQFDLTEPPPKKTKLPFEFIDGKIKLRPDQNLLAEVTRKVDGHTIAIIDTPTNSHIRGVHFKEDDPPRQQNQKEVPEELPPAGDLLNPEAMACFIRLVYQGHYDRLKKHFGKTILAFFTDEPGILGRGAIRGAVPGTTDILEQVNRILGYDFTPHLPALWDDREPNAERHRQDYYRAIRLRLQETYYQPISAWCQEHGVSLTGHPERSDDLGLLKYFQIPGQDVVWNYIEPHNDSGLSGYHSTMAKCASSSMIHLGRRRNLNEFAGAYGHDLSYSTYRWLALWLLIRGCNLLVPHAFYYSIRGPRIDERPRDVGANSPWWNDYKTFSDLTGRICWINTDSQLICHTAILCPDENLPWRAARACFESQRDFNYLEDRLPGEEAQLTDKGLEIAGMTYSHLILEEGHEPELTHHGQTILKQLKEEGRLLTLQQKDDPDSFCQQLPEPVSLTPSNKDIRVRRVIKEKKIWSLIFNEGGGPFEGKISLLHQSSGHLLNLETLEHREWDKDEQICLQPHECWVIVTEVPTP